MIIMHISMLIIMEIYYANYAVYYYANYEDNMQWTILWNAMIWK